MVAFLALYRGPSIGEARLVAVSMEKDLLGLAIDEMLREARQGSKDAVTGALSSGKRQALEYVREELGRGG